jgi:hypothetical protein
VPEYFTDRDLGKQFPEALRLAGLIVHAAHEHFAHDTPDTAWIAEVSRRGWIALTRDQRIRYKPNELAAVLDGGLGLIVLVGQATSAELAETFIRTHARIESFIDRHDPPFIAGLSRPSPAERARRPDAPGRIELRWPARRRRK